MRENRRVIEETSRLSLTKGEDTSKKLIWWVVVLGGMLIATAVIASSQPKQTQTETDPENIYKEITYRPESTYPTEPFPIGNPEPKPEPIVIPKVTEAPIHTEEMARYWIISHEGGPRSVNPSSYACGMPQSNPCDKLVDFAGVYHEFPVDIRYYTIPEVQAMLDQIPVATQLAWMDRYVAARYTTYMGAYNYWLAHGNY